MKQNSRNNEKVISINISDESSNESQSNESLIEQKKSYENIE